MPFAASCMDPETVMLSEVHQKREREILYEILHMQNPKINDKNELTYKTETDSQTRE